MNRWEYQKNEWKNLLEISIYEFKKAVEIARVAIMPSSKNLIFFQQHNCLVSRSLIWLRACGRLKIGSKSICKVKSELMAFYFTRTLNMNWLSSRVKRPLTRVKSYVSLWNNICAPLLCRLSINFNCFSIVLNMQLIVPHLVVSSTKTKLQ